MNAHRRQEKELGVSGFLVLVLLYMGVPSLAVGGWAYFHWNSLNSAAMWAGCTFGGLLLMTVLLRAGAAVRRRQPKRK